MKERNCMKDIGMGGRIALIGSYMYRKFSEK
jgi:hypothetical protein